MRKLFKLSIFYRKSAILIIQNEPIFGKNLGKQDPIFRENWYFATNPNKEVQIYIYIYLIKIYPEYPGIYDMAA